MEHLSRNGRSNNPFHYSVGSRVREIPFMNMLAPEEGDMILDVGCGLGYFSNMLNSNGATCTGIDLDERCIEYCQENMRGKYLVANITNIPFPDNSFNKILCTEVLEHVENNGDVLDEIVRVTQNNGIVIASTPCSSGMFKGFFKRIGHNSVDENSREYHYHKGYTEQTLSSLLQEHNIVPVETYYTLVALAELYMAISKIVVQKIMKSKIRSQANALEIIDSFAWKVNVASIPAIMRIINAEQKLSRRLKGHMIIMKGIVNK